MFSLNLELCARFFIDSAQSYYYIILLNSHYDHVQIEQVLMQNALTVREASFIKMFEIPFHSSNPNND